MPNRFSILNNTNIDAIRKGYLKELNNHTKNDVILYAGSFLSVSNKTQVEASSISVHDIQLFMAVLNNLKGKKLDLILHSPGGSIEATEQLVNYLREKYNTIRAIIPGNAMSAATMLACACDEIIMAKHSALGPIDPQINGISVHYIIEEYKLAKKELKENQIMLPIWANRIQNYPNLKLCSDVIELSTEKVKGWLNEYMFKGQKTKNNGEKIATWLSDTTTHKIHGRPISYKLAKQKGLKVTLLENDQPLQEKVLSVFHALMIAFDKTSCCKLVENHLGFGSYVNKNQSG